MRSCRDESATSKDTPKQHPQVFEIENDDKNGSCCGVRHIQVVLLFVALILAYMMRVNMSVGIVAMTTVRNDNVTDSTMTIFNWDHTTQAMLLSSFFWGYVILQIPAGTMASKYSAKILVGLCIVINGGLSYLLPTVAAKYDWIGVCACRILQGLTQGFLFPCVHSLLAKWVTPDEKSRLCAIVYAGAQLGTAIELMLAGILAESKWGWPSIFHSLGWFSIAWGVVWWHFGSDSPDKTWYITEKEKNYIRNALGNASNKKNSTPWKDIFTSMPFWALVVAHIGQNWGFWTLFTETPSYLNKVLDVDMKSRTSQGTPSRYVDFIQKSTKNQLKAIPHNKVSAIWLPEGTNGIFSALPYMAQFITAFPVGILSDLAINRKWCKITTARKIFNTIGQWGPAVALIALAYTPAGDITFAVVFLILTVGINAGHFSGYLVVHIDMAPNFAGILMGFTNCFANLVSIIAPLTVGAIVDDQSNPHEWRKIFFISAAVYFICNLFFLVFGTCERQAWNEPKDSDVEKGTKNSEEKFVPEIH